MRGCHLLAELHSFRLPRVAPRFQMEERMGLDSGTSRYTPLARLLSLGCSIIALFAAVTGLAFAAYGLLYIFHGWG